MKDREDIPELDPYTEKLICDEVARQSDKLIEAIRQIVQVDSTQGEPHPGAPFGLGCRQALDQTLSLARRMGFETKDLDGYAGYATWRPTCDNPLPGYICAIGHLDVVPVGTGWRKAPFSGYLEEGVIYSRGVLDNKGPLYACLFALAALRHLGLASRRETRIIFGCNEETGMNDIRHYLACEPAPVMGFTPDCKYPVVYAERGRARIHLAPSPQGSLSDETYAQAVSRLFDLVNDRILNARPNGERLGIALQDPEFGVTEVRNYRLLHHDGEPCAELAVSYPAVTTGPELIERMNDALSTTGYAATLVSDLAPVRFERDCRLVRTLVQTYEHVTGLDGTPVTTTGGTYAKVMPHIVPFGPSFPGQKGIGHQPNEWMTVEDIITNAKIYALSLYLLGQ